MSDLDTFEPDLCRAGEGGQLRLYRTDANTEREVGVLLRLAEKWATPWFPTLFCGEGSSAYVIGIAQSHGFADIPSVNDYEWDHYPAFVAAYAEEYPTCQIFAPEDEA